MLMSSGATFLVKICKTLWKLYKKSQIYFYHKRFKNIEVRRVRYWHFLSPLSSPISCPTLLLSILLVQFPSILSAWYNIFSCHPGLAVASQLCIQRGTFVNPSNTKSKIDFTFPLVEVTRVVRIRGFCIKSVNNIF